MAGTAAAGELTASARPSALGAARTGRPHAPSGGTDYRLAGPADDGAIRRLLRENAFEGALRLSFECEPGALAAAGVYGPVHQTIVAEHAGRLLAIGCRAERDAFVNGRAQRLGYLCQLRIDESARWRPRLLAGGFEFCRRLHEAGDAAAYLVSIIDDNMPARRLLESSRIPGAPRMQPLESFVTFVIPTRQRLTRLPLSPPIERGRPDLIEPIVECLRRYGARHQFAPVWTAEDVLSAARTPNLRPDDFLLVRERGRVIACLARWDQRPFRQTVVRGYSPWLSRGRVALNVAARLTGRARLPAPGSALAFAFLSHVAFDDEPGLVLTLIEHALGEAREEGLDYLVFGAASRHPLARLVARRFRHRRYLSQLSLAFWPDGASFVRALDGRIAHPEVSIL